MKQRNFSLFSLPKTGKNTVLTAAGAVPETEEKPNDVKLKEEELNKKENELKNKEKELNDREEAVKKRENEVSEREKSVEARKKEIDEKNENFSAALKRHKTDQSLLNYREAMLKEKEDNFNQYFAEFIREKSDFIQRESLIKERLELAEATLKTPKQTGDSAELVDKKELDEERKKLMEQIDAFQKQKELFDEERAILNAAKSHQADKSSQRTPETELSFIEQERKVLTMQQKKFNEEKQQFEETRRKFEKRFSEYLASKEEQMLQDQQLKEEQNDIDLLRGALVQAKKELKKKKLELQNVHSALINERDSINDGWHRLEIQVEKLKQARIDIEIEKEKIANEKHEIELEKEKMKLLDSHYAEVEKSVDLVAKKFAIDEAKVYHEIPEGESIKSLSQIHEMFRAKEIEYRKATERAEKNAENYRKQLAKVRYESKKTISSLSNQVETLEKSNETYKHEAIKAQTEMQESNTAAILLAQKLDAAKNTVEKLKSEKKKYEMMLRGQIVSKKISETNKEDDEESLRETIEEELREKLDKEYAAKFESALLDARNEITKQKKKKMKEKIDEIKEEYDIRFEKMKAQLLKKNEEVH